MPPNPTTLGAHDPPRGAINYVIRGLSIFTLVMTIPQVLAIWLSRQARGVSVLSWSAYLLSAVVWFWYGLQKHDKNIYLPCIGWMLVDGAVIAGVLLYG